MASTKVEELRRKDLRNVTVSKHIETMNGAFETGIPNCHLNVLGRLRYGQNYNWKRTTNL